MSVVREQGERIDPAVAVRDIADGRTGLGHGRDVDLDDVDPADGTDHGDPSRSRLPLAGEQARTITRVAALDPRECGCAAQTVGADADDDDSGPGAERGWVECRVGRGAVLWVKAVVAQNRFGSCAWHRA